MDAKSAMRHIVKNSGKAKAAISRELGKSDNYINAMHVMQRSPGSDVLAAIAQACGYTLALVPHGSALPSGSIVLDGKDG